MKRTMTHRLPAALLGLAIAGCTAQPQDGLNYAPPPPPAPAAAAAFPPAPAEQERKCRTVGTVTTCDAPADPESDRTLYTN